MLNFFYLVNALICVIFKYSIVDENTDKLTWILDITVAYSEGKPLDLPTIIMGQRRACRTHMYYRLFPSSIV